MEGLREDTDATLIVRSVRDPELFGELFRRHGDDVLRYLARRVGADHAGPLAADTFVVAFERRAMFRADHDSVRPWLFGIAVRLAANDRRREQRRLVALARLDGAPSDGRSSDEPADVAVTDETERRLASVLAELPVAERDALGLFAWADLSYAQIAEVLEVPIGTVRSRISRARARVREALPDLIDDPRGTDAD